MDLATENYEYARRVSYGFCRSYNILSPDLRDDVIGWGMVGLVKASNRWDGRGEFQPYCYSYIVNTIRDGLRQFLGRRGQKNHIPSNDSLDTLFVDTSFDTVDDIDMIERIQNILSPKEFDFVVVAEFCEKKQVISDKWGVSAGRISQLRKSKRIQELLSPHFKGQ